MVRGNVRRVFPRDAPESPFPALADPLKRVSEPPPRVEVGLPIIPPPQAGTYLRDSPPGFYSENTAVPLPNPDGAFAAAVISSSGIDETFRYIRHCLRRRFPFRGGSSRRFWGKGGKFLRNLEKYRRFPITPNSLSGYSSGFFKII
jgi:hypothetical protein